MKVHEENEKDEDDEEEIEEEGDVGEGTGGLEVERRLHLFDVASPEDGDEEGQGHGCC